MFFSDDLFVLFRQNLEGKGMVYESPVQEEMSSRKIHFLIDQNQQVMPFDCDNIHICEPEKGRLTFGERRTRTTRASLAYQNNRWYIKATNKQVDVWLSGIRLKCGQPYLVCSGDQIVLKDMVSFTVQCHPDGIQTPNRIEQMLSNLEKDIEMYVRSQKSDQTAYKRILDALHHVPMYCWGYFKKDPATGQDRYEFVSIPVYRDADWHPTDDLFDGSKKEQKIPMYVPIFTDAHHAEKGNNVLGAFPYDFPLPIFAKIEKMNMDVVINPFSEYSVMIPQEEVKKLWRKIEEQNAAENCPEPGVRMHSKLASQMLELEDDEDF